IIYAREDMRRARNHAYAVGHRHAGHLQGRVQVRRAVVYPRDHMAVQVKQRRHPLHCRTTAACAKTPPLASAMSTHDDIPLLRILLCKGSEAQSRKIT